MKAPPWTFRNLHDDVVRCRFGLVVEGQEDRGGSWEQSWSRLGGRKHWHYKARWRHAAMPEPRKQGISELSKKTTLEMWWFVLGVASDGTGGAFALVYW